MQVGLLLSVHLFLFHQYVSFSRSSHQQDFAGLVGLSVSFTTFCGAQMSLYPLWVPAIVCFVISWGQSWRQRNDYWRMVYSKCSRNTFSPKGIVYPAVIALFVISFVVVNASDLLSQEQDYVYDSLVLLVIGCLWATQPAHLRKRDVANIGVIVVALKVLYFCDNEHGVNVPLDP